ncbi:uncharacterized protein LOC127855045 [Dreissena polymorpha]|uniref:Receptor protein-tyrosine kinase n=1 Tax=Dreissena polymorpha TaxID=45954 RepID=A0A9D4C460_DREPO|nr:uncharacterized protein LOC127855045 [Dreissena polymorpha]KAH3716775.1 hypothetical protein DPMN_059504 [Dreissena polymorpha]
MHGGAVCLLLSVFCLYVTHHGVHGWQGNYERVQMRGEQLRSYCICWYGWWGCSAWRNYWQTYYYYVTRCRAGWTDENGDQNCNKPICNPSCANGGKCVNPNVCDCPSTAQGPYCQTLTCSYLLPCYPGECKDGPNCTCSPGFTSIKPADGCLNFQESEKRLRPVIGESNVTIKDIRRDNNRVNYMFVLEVSDVNSSIVWSNQQRFNFLKFEMRALYDGVNNLPNRPLYVHDTKMGIVQNIITANVSKLPRAGIVRDPGSFKEYPCQEGYSNDNPYVETALCVINDDQFVTLIEHGDWLTVKFRSISGGFQKLINLDQQGRPYATKYYNGLSVIKTVEFRFDFDAPKHCSEVAVSSCPSNYTILAIAETFTKGPIRPRWLGWTDIVSGVGEYYMEVFKLGPNRDKRLVETTPINPVYSVIVPHTNDPIQYPVFTPVEPGMYSVLLEVRDNANNSRIARRFVLYDNTSSISLNNDTAKLYVSSAVEETGYKWQAPASTGTNVTVSVAWPNYFVNRLHVDNQFLAEIEKFPVQFKEIQADGVLSSEKYVADTLDDNEGPRTRSAITHFHGIVKYEIVFVSTVEAAEPISGWLPIDLKESFTTQRPLVDGDRLRVWVRATDVMGNQRADSTIIKVDGSKPRLQANTSRLELNTGNGPYNYSSKVVFPASDVESGVHKIGFDIFVGTDPSNQATMKRVYSNFTSGNIGSIGNAECRDVDGVCFLSSQTVFLDNCWMLVGKSDLDKVSAMVNVTAYNQAMLGTSATINLGPVNKLQGLEKYDGPQNPRIVNKTPNGFRITWDLPEKQSCYGTADIVIILSRKTATSEDLLQTYYTPGTSNHFDILGLNPETEYTLGLNIQTPGTPAQQTDFLTTKTEKESEGVSKGALVGAIVGVLAVAAIAIVAVVVMSRKGIIHPVTQVRSIQRQVTQRVRRSRAGQEHFNFGYKNDSDDLYLYGGMNYAQTKVLSRDDVVLESLLKAGHFADIYMAKYRGQTVVAKTLKQHFSKRDEHVMKAKINFSSEKVGDHPHVLKYLGAVVEGPIGPFIVYEYCDNGTLKDFLLRKKSNLTIDVQEMLFRFGLDLAKGMEYLAGIKITHRRLAARNILLTFLNEIKISGFGPQPEEEADGDAEGGKGERIPVKWMAPECMVSTKKANEKSDVWSFAVVLWEIFSLGDNPYEKIRSQDLLSQLKNDVRLRKPEQSDDVWYGVMKRCWAFDANRRPRFAEVRQQLESLFVAGPGDDYIYSKQ